jgi:hypothetical protein
MRQYPSIAYTVDQKMGCNFKWNLKTNILWQRLSMRFTRCSMVPKGSTILPKGVNITELKIKSSSGVKIERVSPAI